jgi:hypothetical protein
MHKIFFATNRYGIGMFPGEFLYLIKEIFKRTFHSIPQVSLADLFSFDMIQLLKMEEQGLIAAYPNLQKHQLKIADIPNIKTYLKSRPETAW